MGQMLLRLEAVGRRRRSFENVPGHSVPFLIGVLDRIVLVGIIGIGLVGVILLVVVLVGVFGFALIGAVLFLVGVFVLFLFLIGIVGRVGHRGSFLDHERQEVSLLLVERIEHLLDGLATLGVFVCMRQTLRHVASF